MFSKRELELLLAMAKTSRKNIPPHLAKSDPEAVLEILSIIIKLEAAIEEKS